MTPLADAPIWTRQRLQLVEPELARIASLYSGCSVEAQHDDAMATMAVARWLAAQMAPLLEHLKNFDAPDGFNWDEVTGPIEALAGQDMARWSEATMQTLYEQEALDA